MTRNLDLGLDAECRLLKVQLQVVSQIGSPAGLGASTRSSSKQVPEAEEISQDISKIGKDVRIETCRPASHASMPEAVVPGPACPRR